MRFYAESDGDDGNRRFYVVDTYANPLDDNRRTDCNSRRNARKLAAMWNDRPPWSAWDAIQAQRDGFTEPDSYPPPHQWIHLTT